MSFTINFYNVTNENNKLNKTLGTATELTGTFKNETDIINPEIILEVSNSVITHATNPFIKKNYMYIPTLKRYYFITDMTIVQSNMIRVRGHIDVLMTYNTEIKAMRGIVDRQENLYNLYLNDPSLKKLAYPLIQQKAFPNMIQSSDYHFFLITAGG